MTQTIGYEEKALSNERVLGDGTLVDTGPQM